MENILKSSLCTSQPHDSGWSPLGLEVKITTPVVIRVSASPVGTSGGVQLGERTSGMWMELVALPRALAAWAGVLIVTAELSSRTVQ